jgi:hypothetical protein
MKQARRSALLRQRQDQGVHRTILIPEEARSPWMEQTGGQLKIRLHQALIIEANVAKTILLLPQPYRPYQMDMITFVSGHGGTFCPVQLPDSQPPAPIWPGLRTPITSQLLGGQQSTEPTENPGDQQQE